MNLVATLKQKLFRWQSDGVEPLRLGQRRIFILPTRGGLLYAIALIVMLLGAINYTLALGHALVFLLVGIGLVAMIHTFRNLHGLIVAPGRSEPVFAGETANFELILDNERPSPRLALELAADPSRSVLVAVNGKNRANLKVPVQTKRRGWLELPRVRLSTRYPLGLFVAWSYLQPSLRCLVYPSPQSFPLPAPSAAQASGERSGDGGQDDFAGFRERQPADSPRHIAWKTSARRSDSQPLLVKQFAGGAQQELMLDWALTPVDWPLEKRIACLTGWVLAAEAAQASYALILPGERVATASGERHLHTCLKALALFQG